MPKELDVLIGTTASIQELVPSISDALGLGKALVIDRLRPKAEPRAAAYVRVAGDHRHYALAFAPEGEFANRGLSGFGWYMEIVRHPPRDESFETARREFDKFGTDTMEKIAGHLGVPCLLVQDDLIINWTPKEIGGERSQFSPPGNVNTRLEFRRTWEGPYVVAYPVPDWNAVVGLLSSYLESRAAVAKLIDALRTAMTRGEPLDAKWHGEFALRVAGGRASLSGFLEPIPPIEVACSSLVLLLEAWLSFLERGTPTSWTESPP